MKILFFDMEFADGRVKGSIYSIGYMVTDENFDVIQPPADLLIHPDSSWNSYVLENILAYPREAVEASPKFPEVYDTVRALFEDADVAVGFALNNDTGALRADCVRYGLPPMNFRWFDTERLCRRLDEHSDARGLAGCVRAWCGRDPDNQHRSDGDAYATMLLLRAICRAKHVTADMLLAAYPECAGDTKSRAKRGRGQEPRGKQKRRRGRSGKKPLSTQKPDETAT